jgi:antitoxin ParD1/3/4/toxin ParE1/3/4
MTDDQGFRLHPGAAQDITEIWEFVAEDNPLAAKRVREDILDAIRKLVLLPHQGHKRSDLTSQPLRFQTIRDYLVAYAPDEKPLVVIGCFTVAAIRASSQPSCVEENELHALRSVSALIVRFGRLPPMHLPDHGRLASFDSLRLHSSCFAEKRKMSKILRANWLLEENGSSNN